MNYTREDLNRRTIHSLRIIGREVGVKSPTVLSKGTLIDEIIAISSGEKEPSFTKLGRPSFESYVCATEDGMKIAPKEKPPKEKTDFEKELDDAYEQFKKVLLKYTRRTRKRNE